MDHSISANAKLRKINIGNLKPNFGVFSFVVDFFLLTLSYFVFYYLRHSSWNLSANYYPVLLLIYGVWLIVSLFMGKYRKEKYTGFGKALLLALKSTAYMAYLMSFAIIFLEFFTFSRAHVFGTCVVYGIFQLNWVAILFLLRGKEFALDEVKRKYPLKQRYPFAIRRFLADFLLITAAFYFLNYIKRDTFVLSSEYEKAFLIVLGVWFFSSIYTGKFSARRYPNFVHAIMPYIKAVIISVMLMSVLIFFFRMMYFSRLHIFGTFLILGVAEVLLHFFYSDLPMKTTRHRDVETVDEAEEILREEQAQSMPAESKELYETTAPDVTPASEDSLIRNRLKDHFLKNLPGLFGFLESRIDLSKISIHKTVVLNTHTPYNVETIQDGSLNLFINLHRLNDIRRINRYFLEVHKKFSSPQPQLVDMPSGNGSYFVGAAETINTRYNTIMSKYPKYVAEIIYALDFMIHRVLPKIPLLKNLYFTASRGKNRVISEAEVLGRLYFCGFEVLASQSINNLFYFVARRVKHPSIDQNPSYGPLIKLPRIGYGGNLIYVNKFRTMHPYSEYIQDYIYEQNRLQLNGKFQDDFRVTKWGKIFRKMWIDELPQISNFLRGDISLVGVRALSEHYFKLYPEDLKRLRIKFKPGLIPPFYADMPKTFDEIMESERTYLLSKQQRPFRTDVRYFSKALYNIFFKNARSA